MWYIICVLLIIGVIFLLKRKELKENIADGLIPMLLISVIILIPILFVIFYFEKQYKKNETTFSYIKEQQAKNDSILNNIIHDIKGLKFDSARTLINNRTDSLILINNKLVLNIANQIETLKLDNASRNILVNGISSVSGKSEKYKWWFIANPIFIGLTVLLFLISILVKKESRKKWLIAASASGLLTMGGKLVIEGELALNPEFNIEFNKCDTTKNNLLVDTISIGPFKSGFDTLEPIALSKLEILKQTFLDKTRMISEITIYGGVDKRPLKRKSLLLYGDNLTLAQARANHIEKYIRNIWGLNQKMPQINISVNGANTYTTSFDSVSFANSRYVKIVTNYMKAN